jgi:hypothetical protein
MVAKKHISVAKAMLIEPGGSTYPVPRHVMEMPKADGLINRALKEKTKSTSAAITNSSEERPILTSMAIKFAPNGW